MPSWFSANSMSEERHFPGPPSELADTLNHWRDLFQRKHAEDFEALEGLTGMEDPIFSFLVDYADILMPTGNFREKRHAIGNIYEDLRGLAGELEVPIWTASQANRSALEEDVIGADKVAEDYSKVMTADFVMSMSRKVEDKIANTGRFHVIKNRFGMDGVTYPSTINTNIGQVQIFEGSSQFGKDAQSKMNNNEEFLRKELANKYKDMGKKVEGFE